MKSTDSHIREVFSTYHRSSEPDKLQHQEQPDTRVPNGTQRFVVRDEGLVLNKIQDKMGDARPSESVRAHEPLKKRKEAKESERKQSAFEAPFQSRGGGNDY
jgi:hypothetical protein